MDAFGAFHRDGDVREPPPPTPPANSFGGGGATAADVWRHENGHARLLRRYGVGVAGQRVYPDGGGGWAGYTEPASWGRFMRLPAEQQIAIYAAGGVAMGSHSHDYLDDGNIRQIVKDVPWGQRAALEARGRARARRDL